MHSVCKLSPQVLPTSFEQEACPLDPGGHWYPKATHSRQRRMDPSLGSARKDGRAEMTSLYSPHQPITTKAQRKRDEGVHPGGGPSSEKTDYGASADPSEWRKLEGWLRHWGSKSVAVRKGRQGIGALPSGIGALTQLSVPMRLSGFLI